MTQLAGIAPAASVRIRDTDGKVSTVPLTAPSMVMGRAADAQIRLEHGMVSRHHAQITRGIDGRFILRDLGSRNGTSINGTILTERILLPGDQIGIGPFTLTFSTGERDPATTQSMRMPVADSSAGQIATLRDVGYPRVVATQLLLVSDFFERLLNIPDAQERSVQLCRLMTDAKLHGQWAAVVRLPANEDEDPVLLAESRRGPGAPQTPYLSRGVLRAVRHKREPIVASNVAQQADVMMSMAPSVMMLATVACPLEMRGLEMDILYAIFPPQYGTGEWLALASLGAKQYQQAEAAWVARRQAEVHAVMERDLARARQIQMRLVPDDPQVTGLDLAIGFAPCRGVGGDYVDVVPCADGRVFLAVADVCGKGLPAALVASSIHTMVHASLMASLDLCTLIRNLNDYLCRMLSEDSFVTMVAVMLDLKTGDVEYVNAGHPLPLILAPGGQHRTLAAGNNLPLRIECDAPRCATDRLAPGELLTLYTDGLTEIGQGAGMLGAAGLTAELAALYPSTAIPARDVAAALNRRLNTLQGSTDPQDDRTFLLARIG